MFPKCHEKQDGYDEAAGNNTYHHGTYGDPEESAALVKDFNFIFFFRHMACLAMI